MKFVYIILSIMLFISCTDKNADQVKNEVDRAKSKTVVSGFQSILNSANVHGSILIYDLNTDSYYSNNFQWANKGQLPASTFKIPNSIIALETRVVENDTTLFKWNGEERFLKSWEQDLAFKEAFHYSCVPCYQDVAREIGVKRMVENLKRLDYGNMIVDSTNIDMFWLRGESRITQVQQIDFLKKFYQSGLSISERTETIMRRMMVIDRNESYTISGKTGWSISDTINNGWFVGYVEKEENTWFFATNIEPNPEFDMDSFSMIRKELTYKALEKLKVINPQITAKQAQPLAKNTIQSRIPTPAGYSRTNESAHSFQTYLRSLPVKPPNSKVKYYNGDTKYGDVYEAVVDLPIGDEDLHQCADAVMRLRAEYLWMNKDFDKIHFNFTNGHKVEYSEWMQGNRMNIKGNKTWWTTQAEPSNNYDDFWEYMELIFMYAGTASLEKELKSIPIDEADIGDVLIKGGFPGHAVIIVDKATKGDIGESIYLIAQSYMPAQEIQILKNYSHPDIRPWYRFGEGQIYTPEWEFSSDDLKRFPE